MIRQRKMRKVYKLASAVLTGVLVMASMSTSVWASNAVSDSQAKNDYYLASEVNLRGDNQCDVEATKGSAFMVTIPKKIILSGNGEGSYSVTVDANLAGTEFVKVSPVAKNGGFFLKESGGKADIGYTVKQEKQIFIANGSLSAFNETTGSDCEELKAPDASGKVGDYVVSVTGGEATTVAGSITAPDITAGNWSGAFDFSISLAAKTN